LILSQLELKVAGKHFNFLFEHRTVSIDGTHVSLSYQCYQLTLKVLRMLASVGCVFLTRAMKRTSTRGKANVAPSHIELSFQVEVLWAILCV
jgi:hypothetical protein